LREDLVRRGKRGKEGVPDVVKAKDGFTSQRIVWDIIVGEGVVYGNRGGVFVIDNGDK